MPLLEIEDLHVEFPSHGGVLHAVEGVSLTLDEGEVLGIVGESGSGKSVTMLALMGLVACAGARAREEARVRRPATCCALTDKERRKIVGKDVAMIFQEPTTSLNPCFTIGFQLDRDAEAPSRHGPQGRARSARSSCSSRSASRRRRAGSTTSRTRCRAA